MHTHTHTSLHKCNQLQHTLMVTSKYTNVITRVHTPRPPRLPALSLRGIDVSIGACSFPGRLQYFTARSEEELAGERGPRFNESSPVGGGQRREIMEPQLCVCVCVFERGALWVWCVVGRCV